MMMTVQEMRTFHLGEVLLLTPEDALFILLEDAPFVYV